jgi:hypothetical protein
VSNEIAAEPPIGVAFVFDERNGPIGEPLPQLTAADLEERPNDRVDARIGRCQSTSARPPQQPEQDGLRLIVPGVPHGNTLTVELNHGATESLVPAQPSRILNGPPFAPGASPDVNPLDVHGKRSCCGELAAECLVAIGLDSTKAMVNMRHTRDGKARGPLKL